VGGQLLLHGCFRGIPIARLPAAGRLLSRQGNRDARDGRRTKCDREETCGLTFEQRCSLCPKAATDGGDIGLVVVAWPAPGAVPARSAPDRVRVQMRAAGTAARSHHVVARTPAGRSTNARARSPRRVRGPRRRDTDPVHTAHLRLGRCSRDPPDSRSVCRSCIRDRAARHLDPPRRPEAAADIKEYANRSVLDGSTANVFADKYIAVHLKALAPGETYPQLSAQPLTNLPNPKLVRETQTLFGGETLRAGCSRPGAYASRTFWALSGGRPTQDLPGPGRRRDVVRRSPLMPDVARPMPARAQERFTQIGA
jgi:hypothetical protein